MANKKQEKTKLQKEVEFKNAVNKGIAAFNTFTLLFGGATAAHYLAACKDELDKKCECTVKEHLGIGETCCTPDSPNVCDCGLKVYDNTLVDDLGNTINIYRKGNVADADMTTAIANAIAGYNALSDSDKGNLAGKIKEIHILEEALAEDGKGLAGVYEYEVVGNKVILKFQHDTTFIDDAFWIFANSDLPTIQFAMAKQSKPNALERAIERSQRIYG